MKIRKKIDYISSCDLLYAQKTGDLDDDELFKAVISSLKPQNPFSLKMAYLKLDSIYHCFLTPIAKLKKSFLSFPEPLIFKPLYDENLIDESNFCVLKIYEKNLYLYFYENNNFTNFKKIENFSQTEQFLKENRIIELLKHYESKLLLSFEKENFIAQKSGLKHINLNDLLGENALLSLSFKSANLSQTCSFIRLKDELSIFTKMGILFVFSFFIMLFILLFNDFLAYKQNEETKVKNEIFGEEMARISAQKQKLLSEIKDLNRSVEAEQIIFDEKEQILSKIISKLKPSKKQSEILYKVIFWLNNNELKISRLNLDGKKISISLINAENLENSLKDLDENLELVKENKSEILLEFKNE